VLHTLPRSFSRSKVSNFHLGTTHGVEDKIKIYSAQKRDDKHEVHTHDVIKNQS